MQTPIEDINMESRLDPLVANPAPYKQTLHRHHWRNGILLFLLVASGGFWWSIQARKNEAHPGAPADAPQKASAVRAVVQPIVTTDSPQGLDVTGTVQSELDAAVSSKVMGRVQSVLVREGERVRRGQTLVLLDARDLDASLALANANLRSSGVGYESARVAARMEDAQSAARIAEARAKVAQSEAALQATGAKLDLVQAGPRRQEREQAALAVAQTRAAFTLAENNLKRMHSLYQEGAISAQQFDQVKAQYDVAKSQFETAQQEESLVKEGSRAEEIRAAQETVLQARAAVQEAQAGEKSAQASALQTEVRRQEIQGAQARIGQSQAGLDMAKVARSYAVITAPFDGIVTKRLADPGTMASPGLSLLTVQGGTLRLEAVVPESVLTSVKKGMAVPIYCDALRKRALTGRVVEIAPQGDAGSHTFVVKITLPSGSGAAAGMFGRARFTTGSEKQLLIPDSAVVEREGLHYLYTVDDHSIAHLRMITVGDPVGSQIVVLSGLNSGERVVTEGRERVTDGGRVVGETR